MGGSCFGGFCFCVFSLGVVSWIGVFCFGGAACLLSWVVCCVAVGVVFFCAVFLAIFFVALRAVFLAAFLAAFFAFGGVAELALT